MSQRLTILGCGSSGGVPRIGPDWGACDPTNPRNRRRRASVLVERFAEEGRGVTRVLIDASPDMREQLLDAGVGKLNAVILTHDHADHVHGIDDLRVIAFAMKRRMPVYADASTSEGMQTRFRYCFKQNPGSSYPAILEARVMRAFEPIEIEGPGGTITLLPFDQEHGEIRSLGMRIGDVAYSSDASGFPADSVRVLSGLKTLIIGALRYNPHPSHFTVAQAVTWIGRLKPERAYLTHLHVDLDYEKLKAELPPGIEPAYDGLRIEV
ncbi:MAG: MBL fold metallo-hydrolase [Hyphomicrobiaceae bacterium]|nr:MAG: MBL fold metallo-hydrolase [Hyphomicrobiaceae bacterium]